MRLLHDPPGLVHALAAVLGHGAGARGVPARVVHVLRSVFDRGVPHHYPAQAVADGTLGQAGVHGRCLGALIVGKKGGFFKMIILPVGM